MRFLTFATIFTPQGDGNRKLHTYQHQCHLQHSLRYLPRKGTETNVNNLLRKVKLCSIRYDIYPARGRKLRREYAPISKFLKFATIFTPQGDGNNSRVTRTLIKTKSDSLRYLPRKGTETPECSAHNYYLSFVYSLRYLPRKGTETVHNLVPQPKLLNIRYDIYPARGRKLQYLSQLLALQAQYIRYDIYPARGRKLCQHLFAIWMSFIDSLRYLPRKGTETASNLASGKNSTTTFATIFTPQGDGNISP